MSKIEWTEKTWNPVVGCRRVSPGCENCYAEGTVHRGMSPQHKGLTVLRSGGKGPRWNGRYNVAENRLDEPLRRKKPTTYFVNSLSDLFFEPLPFELIAALFGVMASTPQHTYQVLTKRPARALQFFEWYRETGDAEGARTAIAIAATLFRVRGIESVQAAHAFARAMDRPWPLENVWIGVSVEDQKRADERIPLLLECPAAVRWVSYEPALGPVDFDRWVFDREAAIRAEMRGPAALSYDQADDVIATPLDWIVVGGESGPGARPFDLAWARSTIEQCKAAEVPVFVKQLGARPVTGHEPTGNFRTDPATGERQYEYQTTLIDLLDRKGGDPSEWPEDLRVRQGPTLPASS